LDRKAHARIDSMLPAHHRSPQKVGSKKNKVGGRGASPRTGPFPSHPCLEIRGRKKAAGFGPAAPQSLKSIRNKKRAPAMRAAIVSSGSVWESKRLFHNEEHSRCCGGGTPRKSGVRTKSNAATARRAGPNELAGSAKGTLGLCDRGNSCAHGGRYIPRRLVCWQL